MNRKHLINHATTIGAVLGMFVLAVLAAPRSALAEEITLTHAHGLSYSVPGREVLAVYFDLDGRELWYSSYAGKPQLTRTGWSAAKSTEVALPPLSRDAVAYVAQNPVERQEYAIATFERSVFISKDGGKSWR